MPSMVKPLSSPSVTTASTRGGFLPGSNLCVPAWTTLPSRRTVHLSPAKVIVCFASSSLGLGLPSRSWETNFQFPRFFSSTSLPASLPPPPCKVPPAASEATTTHRHLPRIGIPPSYQPNSCRLKQHT